jgi:uncharacterized protein YegP (UPF0339 family)
MSLSNRLARGLLGVLGGSMLALPKPAAEHTGVRRLGLVGRHTGRIAPHQHAYVVRRGRHAGWRWWLERGDGQQLAASPRPAASPQQARMDTLRVRLAAATSAVETYEDDGHFRWRALSRNGALLAVSAMGYATRVAAERAVATFRLEASHAELYDG